MMGDTPQERIAQAIIAELRRQTDAEKGGTFWVDDEMGTASTTIDGTFDFDKVGEALIDAGLINVAEASDPPERDNDTCKRCGMERRQSCNCDAGFQPVGF